MPADPTQPDCQSTPELLGEEARQKRIDKEAERIGREHGLVDGEGGPDGTAYSMARERIERADERSHKQTLEAIRDEVFRWGQGERPGRICGDVLGHVLRLADADLKGTASTQPVSESPGNSGAKKDRCPTCGSSHPYFSGCKDAGAAKEETGIDFPTLPNGCSDPWHELRIAELTQPVPGNSGGVEEGRIEKLRAAVTALQAAMFLTGSPPKDQDEALAHLAGIVDAISAEADEWVTCECCQKRLPGECAVPNSEDGIDLCGRCVNDLQAPLFKVAQEAVDLFPRVIGNHPIPRLRKMLEGDEDPFPQDQWASRNQPSDAFLELTHERWEAGDGTGTAS